MKCLTDAQEAHQRLLASCLVETHLKKEVVKLDKLGKREDRKRHWNQNPWAVRSRGKKAGRPLTIKPKK